MFLKTKNGVDHFGKQFEPHGLHQQHANTDSK